MSKPTDAEIGISYKGPDTPKRTRPSAEFVGPGPVPDRQEYASVASRSADSADKKKALAEARRALGRAYNSVAPPDLQVGLDANSGAHKQHAKRIEPPVLVQLAGSVRDGFVAFERGFTRVEDEIWDGAKNGLQKITEAFEDLVDEIKR